MPLSEPSLARFRSVVEGALAQLEARRREVNDLNVFPVADGDTGDNMVLTLRAVVSELDPNRYARDLEQLGDSVLVVGDRITLKVHVHTDTPERATALFEGVGEVSHLDVADMRQQLGARSERLAAAAATNGAPAEGPVPVCAVLAVVSGPGMRRLYEETGAHALDGGPTLNPSTYDLLAGVHAVAAEQVVVLPNSPNVIMAAEKAADLSDKQVY